MDTSPRTKEFNVFNFLSCSVNYRKISLAQPESPLESREDGDDETSSRADEVSLPTDEEQWMTFNVGGTNFLTKRSTLVSVPNTVLSDLDEESKHYHAPTGQYLFDRNPVIFQVRWSWLIK